MDAVSFLNQVKTRDAALIYFWLRRKVGGAGRFGSTTFESLASMLNAAGLMTSRAAYFTAAVVRAKIVELEKLGAICRDFVDAGAFLLYVYDPKDCPESSLDSEEPAVDLYAGKSLFDFHFENENENENQNDLSRARKEEYINKKINKQINNPGRGETERERAPEPEPETTGPTPDEATKRVVWSDPEVQRLRSELAAIVWEPDINPELIDRLTAACVLGISGVDRRRVFRIARGAVAERDAYERSQGRAGKSAIWKALGYSVKKIYDAAGYVWTPTAPGMEPEPRRVNPSERVYSPISAVTTGSELEKEDFTEADAEGFDVADLNDDVATFEAKVCRRLHTRAGLDTAARAAKIRHALRGLKLASEMVG